MILESYKNIIGDRNSLYMLRQFLVIIGLFTAGFIPLRLLRSRFGIVWELLLSFPLGISVYSVLGLLLLITGIDFSVPALIIAYAVLIATVIIYGRRLPEKAEEKGTVRIIAAGFVIVFLGGLFAVSPFLSQYVTNDSVYYYSMYPSILVKNGCITADLDKFLTDVGQSTAVLQCLPFLFGFDESFGIQHFLNINFILIFFTGLYESLDTLNINKSMKTGASILGTLLLISSEPFIVLSKWVLSNVYFMDFCFIVFYLILKTERDKDRNEDTDFALVFLISFLIMSRMEGGVLVFVLALAASLLNIDKKRMLLLFGLPLFIMELGYYGMIYLKIGIDPLYSFLDVKTALLMAGLIVLYLVYIMFIRDRVSSLPLGILMLTGLLAGNLILLAINPGRYTSNIKAFILNIRQGNGWGAFIIIIVIYAVLAAAELIKNGFRGLSFPVLLPAALVLAIIAVCFARGGVLAVRTSDSGNRVLMEIVPLCIFTVYTGIWKKGEEQ